MDMGITLKIPGCRAGSPAIVTPRWYTWTGSGARLSGNALAGRLTTGATKAPAHMEDGSFVNRASGSGRDNPWI
ncbi:hypothetical protein GCM10011577_20630 [Pseudarthrobacter polychromogenes]|uniref:Uncharacterized protein n=1 Tax=Pseudarthrobacter polychromogenes TaxID=1676 RepID=A0ABQ1XLV2_9MICC|nr:hypothetical protein GCM10011577_20630 [Pseudarthrobacter polychromogenes]